MEPINLHAPVFLGRGGQNLGTWGSTKMKTVAERRAYRAEAQRKWERSEKGIAYIKSYASIKNAKQRASRRTTDERIKLCWRNIIDRCNNPKLRAYRWYGGKGIQNHLTLEALRRLWERDGASQMTKPTIDRLNSNGHYTWENCEFVELKENIRRKTGMKYRRRGKADESKILNPPGHI